METISIFEMVLLALVNILGLLTRSFIPHLASVVLCGSIIIAYDFPLGIDITLGIIMIWNFFKIVSCEELD